MNLSLGEFRALVAKAVRGAGCSWGMTEEAAYSARRLAEFGFPAGEMVVRLLQSMEGAAPGSLMPRASWKSAGDSLCSICVGTAIADQAGCSDLSLGPTHEPALLAPLLMRTLPEGSAAQYSLLWDGGGCEVSASSITPAGQMPAEAVPVSIHRRVTGDDSGVAIRHTRVEIDPAVMRALEGFAHNVYAPATDESRAAGAGGADD